MVTSRRGDVLKRLQKQLKEGTKTVKVQHQENGRVRVFYEQVELTDKNKIRIKKEIETLKKRV